MRKIVQTLNNQVFFTYNKNTQIWNYKNKTAILDKNIVDELNELWYTLIRRGRIEVFVDFSKTKYIGKFLSERGDM